jgi:hypothetical protein
MSTENQEVTVEPAVEEKSETKEVKGTKRAAEVSIHPSHPLHIITNHILKVTRKRKTRR